MTLAYGPVTAYTRRIRNLGKRAYALAYIDAVRLGIDQYSPAWPDAAAFGIGEMAAQGVRWQLRELGVRPRETRA